MAKICSVCGQQSADNAAICGYCGTPFQVRPQAPAQAPYQARPQAPAQAPYQQARPQAPAQAPKADVLAKLKGFDVKKIKDLGPKALIPVAAIVVVIILAVVISGSIGAKGALKKYYNALEKGNAEKIIELMPEFALEREGMEDAIEKKVEEDFEDSEESYGENFKYSIKIVKVKPLSDDDLEEIEEVYDAADSEAEIKSGKTVYYTYEKEGKYGYSKSGSPSSMIIIKENGKWKVFDGTYVSSYDYY